MDASQYPRSRAADILLGCFWLAALLYVLNVLAWKFSASLPALTKSLALGDVGQFVLMLLGSAFLVAAALVREARHDADQRGVDEKRAITDSESKQFTPIKSCRGERA